MSKKIAIPSDNDLGLSAGVDRHFGRCKYFTIITLSDADGSVENVKILPNPGAEASSGAGPLAAQTIANEHVQILAGGDYGPNAYTVLKKIGIELYGYPSDKQSLKVQELLELIKAKKIAPYKI